MLFFKEVVVICKCGFWEVWKVYDNLGSRERGEFIVVFMFEF